MQQNKSLNEQLSKVQEQRRELQQQVIELERNLAIGKIVNTIASPGAEIPKEGLGRESVEQNEARLMERRQARKYINRLLREIDECLTLLSIPLAGCMQEEEKKE